RLFQQFVDHAGIGLAGHRLHHLADDKAKEHLFTAQSDAAEGAMVVLHRREPPNVRFGYGAASKPVPQPRARWRPRRKPRRAKPASMAACSRRSASAEPLISRTTPRNGMTESTKARPPASAACSVRPARGAVLAP